ncbi:MAG: type III-B CRISPR module-associated protein Cmr5 [Myxococcota bacterium]
MSSNERARAQQAYERVSARAALGGKAWRQYRSIALKLPVMVHNEGLLPALHFVAARGDANQKLILDDLALALEQENQASMLCWMRSLEGDALRNGTLEVQRRLGWYKRLVQAFGKEPVDPGVVP